MCWTFVYVGTQEGLALVSICEIDVTSFSEDARVLNGYVTNPTPTLTPNRNPNSNPNQINERNNFRN